VKGLVNSHVIKLINEIYLLKPAQDVVVIWKNVTVNAECVVKESHNGDASKKVIPGVVECASSIDDVWNVNDCWVDVVVDSIKEFPAQDFVKFIESIGKDDIIHCIVCNNNDAPDTSGVSCDFFGGIKEIVQVWSIQKDLSLIQKTTTLKRYAIK